jgi:hypothetical protein
MKMNVKVPFCWPQSWREQVNDKVCVQCNRLFGAHSMQEFEDCMDKTLLAPDGRTWKEVLFGHQPPESIEDSCRRFQATFRDETAHLVECPFCPKTRSEHTDEEVLACVDILRKKERKKKARQSPRPE